MAIAERRHAFASGTRWPPHRRTESRFVSVKDDRIKRVSSLENMTFSRIQFDQFDHLGDWKISIIQQWKLLATIRLKWSNAVRRERLLDQLHLRLWVRIHREIVLCKCSASSLAPEMIAPAVCWSGSADELDVSALGRSRRPLCRFFGGLALLFELSSIAHRLRELNLARQSRTSPQTKTNFPSFV